MTFIRYQCHETDNFRNGIELPYLAKDDSYDFNYQETRKLLEEREILSGDSLQVVCEYKTKDDRTDMSVVRWHVCFGA